MTSITQKSGFVGLALLFIFFLQGCGENQTSYAYLVQHPEDLQKAYESCIRSGAGSTPSCEVVMHAHSDFSELVLEREQDPERFGAKILQEQENSVYLKKQLETSRTDTSHTLEEREKASDLRVKMMLKVIAVTSSV